MSQNVCLRTSRGAGTVRVAIALRAVRGAWAVRAAWEDWAVREYTAV